MNNQIAGNEPMAETAFALPSAIELPDRRGWSGLLSAAFSIALLLVVADRFRHMSFGAITALVPHQAGFWLLFVASYLAQPVCEWIIYRRLWRIPLSGIGQLLRKLVSNELLLGYLGEVQFYAWARERKSLSTTPFGAIKDVTILSAMVGNLVTLVLLIPAWRLLQNGELGPGSHTLFASLGVVLASSCVIMLLRGRLFTLDGGQLRFIAVMHALRLIAQLGLTALMWQWVLPGVPIHLWFVMATLRMLVSRLPLVPNKDVVFAGLAVILLGHEADIATLLTMMAGLILGAHLIVAAIMGLAGLAGQLQARPDRALG